MDLSAALTAAPTGDRRRLDREAGVLVGSRCRECSTPVWPSRSVCHRCGAAAMREARYGPAGELVSHTTVWVERPGLEAPFTLAEIRLEDGPRVFGHLRALPPEGEPARAVRLRVADGEDAVPPFWFEPVATSAEERPSP